MRALTADAYILTALDEVAWLFNVRGHDIPYNPLVVSYGVISEESAVWFVRAGAVSAEVSEALAEAGVEIRDYAALAHHLVDLAQREVCEPKILNPKP
jgi:Xaa-Pro aminopeptidase